MGLGDPGGRYRSGSEPHTTNQRMELEAALDAVRSIEGAVEVVSDSAYVVNCFRQGWWKGWLARGWINTKKRRWRTVIYGNPWSTSTGPGRSASGG